MGSTSAGAQGVGFGVSLGSTYTDSDCIRRKDARELHNMGHATAAIHLLCQNDAVRQAMEDAGDTGCVVSAASQRAKAASAEVGNEYSDSSTARQQSVRDYWKSKNN